MNRAILLVALTGLATHTLADDLTPPPWRFTPGSTTQHWDFSAGPGGGVPDAGPLNIPFGVPLMAPSTGAIWQPNYAGRNDVWLLTPSESLQFDIPNAGVQPHMKNLWLQLTYYDLSGAGGPSVVISSASGLFTQTNSTVTPLGNGWVHELTEWTIGQCPSFERMVISSAQPGAFYGIDQVVIDTQCIPVPSPAAASVLGLAGLFAARRRR